VVSVGLDGRGLVAHDQTSIADVGRRGPICRSAASRSGVDGIHFQHRGQLDELCLVLVGVMLAEQQLGSGRELGANTGSRAAPVTAIQPE